MKHSTSKQLQRSFLIIASFLLFSCNYCENKQTETGFESRGGLPNFFSKIINSDEVSVAYFGGSITAMEGWRSMSFSWLQENYPNASFKQINAAIPGTNSELGVIRIDEQVLKQNPDLIFVEFAVNDDGRTEKEIGGTMEGIVRKIWKHNPSTDICFVYTIKKEFLQYIENGEYAPSSATMEKIANHYGIPSLNFGFKVAELCADSLMIFSGSQEEINGIPVFSKDDVHPYTKTGHPVYFNQLKKFLLQMDSVNKAHDHHIPAPLYGSEWERARMIDPEGLSLSNGWIKLDTAENDMAKKFKRFLPFLLKADRSGESISFSFNGTAVGLYDIMGPGVGRILVTLDDSPTDTVYRFDKYCTWFRMNHFMLRDLKDTLHSVRFESLTSDFNKSEILNKSIESFHDKEIYQENSIYVGKVILNGEVQ